QQSGFYYAELTGAGDSDYSLVVTRNADFDLESNDDDAHAQDLSQAHAVLGAIGNGMASPDTDWNAFAVNAGTTLTLTTTTPSDQGGEFHNSLVPQIDLYDPLVNLVDSNAGGPKNGPLTYVAQTTGTYFARVSGANQSTGEYVLDVNGLTLGNST